MAFSPDLNRENLEDLYPLAPLQEGLLYQATAEPDSRAYVEQQAWRVTGPLEPRWVEAGWNELVRRHAVLRTNFVAQKAKRPLQMVWKERRGDFTFLDLRELPPEGRGSHAQELREADVRRGFDLARDVLARVQLLRLSDHEYELILTLHHILMDGWCTGIVLNEWLEFYQAFQAGRTPELPPAPPYRRYIQWLETQDRAAAPAYWEKTLSGFTQRTPILGRRREGPADFKTYDFSLTAAADAELRTAAARSRTTPSTMIQAAWGLVLQRLHGVNDAVFGSIVSGRPPELPEVERMVGLFINAVPVRVCGRDGESFRQLVVRLQAQAMEAVPHHYCPLGDIQQRSQFKRDLFDHLAVFENFPLSPPMKTADLKFEAIARHERTHYDFVLVVAPGTPLKFQFQYNAAAMDRFQVKLLADRLRQALGSAVFNPDQPCSAVDVVASDERNFLLNELSVPARPLPEPASVTALFDRCLRENADRPAVFQKDGCWTYADLERRSNALARALTEHVRSDHEACVAVLADRSPWLPAALLGVLKAGAVYVPLDPVSPPDRLRFMLRDVECRALVAGPGLLELARSIAGHLPLIEPAKLPDVGEPLNVVLSPERAAYAIFTSGSTGQPKAVVVEHRSAVNLCLWHQDFYRVGTASRATLFASPCFDASLWEMLPYLTAGACLYPVEPAARENVEELISFQLRHGITHAFVPPALCEEVCRRQAGRLSGKMRLLTGGDVLRFFGDGSLQVVNNYGPTEYAVVATAEYLDAARHAQDIPIGRPIAGTEVLLLDAQLRLVPFGGIGEICLSGAGLARGYLNRPELNAEKFVAHPFRSGCRMYRTGDLGRWRNDRSLEFLGRRDAQVKIRGFRIEPAEIEARLREHADVVGAAVLPHRNAAGETELAAYVVVPAAVGLESLRVHLAALLPAYMIPTHFIRMERLPVTAAGKTDRAALPPPEPLAVVAVSEPRTAVETALANIWETVLARPVRGANENFFDLGGHSVAAMRVAGLIRDRLQVEPSLRALFDHPTVASLAVVVEQLRNAASPASKEPALVKRDRKAYLDGDAEKNRR